MSELFAVVMAVIEEFAWSHAVLPDREVVQIDFAGNNGNFTFFAEARPDRPVVLCYSVYDRRVPEDRRADVAQTLTRLNYPLIIGNFEMDFADGEVRYRSSLDLRDAPIAKPLIRNVILPNLRTTDEFLPQVSEAAGIKLS